MRGLLVDASTWLLIPPLILFSFAGLGAWFARRASGMLALLVATAAGALVLLSAVASINFVSPIPSWAGPAVIALGALGLARNTRRLNIAPRDLMVTGAFYVVGSAVYRTGLHPAQVMRAPGLHPDAVGYHVGLVAWMEQGPLPLGLGLLQSRFAFNPGLTLLIGAFRTSGDSASQHLLVEAAIVAFGLTVAACAALAMRQKSRSDAAAVFAVLLFASLYLITITPRAGTDLGTALTAIAAVASAVVVSRLAGDATIDSWYGLLILLVALAVVQKTSALSTVLLLLAPMARGGGIRRALLGSSSVAATAVLAAASTVIWSVRGFVMSGCFAYPVAFTCADVSWGLGSGSAVRMSAVIRSWARDQTSSGSADLLGFAWLPTWVTSYSSGHSAALAVIVAVGVVARVVSLSTARTSASERAGPLPTSVRAYILISLVIWFIGAPDPRFAVHLHILVAAWFATPLLGAVLQSLDSLSMRRRRVSYSIALSLPVVAALGVGVLQGPTFPVTGDNSGEFRQGSLPLVSPSATETDWMYFLPPGGGCGSRIPCTTDTGAASVDTRGRRIAFRNS